MGLRNEAMLSGAATYFTGIPCLHGHLAKRQTINAACMECGKGTKGEALKEWRKNNPEKNTIQRKRQAEEYREKLNNCPKYREENREQIRINAKKWREENKEKVNRAGAVYREENKEQLRLTAKKWREENKGKKNAYGAERRAAKLQRTPSWLTKEQKERVSCYYQVAAMRTRESDCVWHVDHIVPLCGKSVSGLHVPWNLQVIPAQENMSKGNRHGN